MQTETPDPTIFWNSATNFRDELRLLVKRGLTARFLESLSLREILHLLRREWPVFSRLAQRPPISRWRNWLFLGGRGAGKTHAGAQWTAGIAGKDEHFFPFGADRIALVGETYGDARMVMVEGEFGLLAIPGKGGRPQWN